MTTAAPRTSAMPWGTVVVFALAGFLMMTTSLMTTGLLPAMARDLRVSEGAAGSLTSVFALAIVVTVLPLTRLSLRFSRRAVMVGTSFLLVLSNALVAAAPVLAVALVGRFLGGVALALLVPALTGTIARTVAPELVPRAMAFVLAGNSGGMALGAPLAAVLGTTVGWRGAFAVTALLGVGIAIALHRVVPHLVIDASRTGSVGQAARTPGVLRAAISWSIALVGHYAGMTFIAPLFLALGGSPAQVGLPILVLGCAGLVGVLLAGRISLDHVLAGCAIAFAAIGVAFLLLALAPPLAAVYAVLVLWGAGYSAAVHLNQQTVLLLGHRSPELALSLLLLTSQLGIALGASVGGATLEAAGALAIPLVAAGAVAVGLLALIGLPPVVRAAREQQRRGRDVP